jgi:endonuclease/exonuclease/phosphatase family metal-dependent hydrolase
MSRVQIAATAWLAFVIALICFQAIFPQRAGVLAVTQVLEPYIAITGIVAALVAVRPGPPIIRDLALVLIAVLGVRCGPSLVSNPTPELGGATVGAMTWNVLADDAANRTVSAVAESGATLVGLQELQPDAASALEADPRISSALPYQALEPDSSVLGIGLLSAFPILEHSVSVGPPFIRAVVQTHTARPTIVYVIHPMPAPISSLGSIPLALDTTKRDADIAFIRSRVDADLASGSLVLVMGDMNTTEREPAYHDMSAGLKDAHLEAGIGPGLTWRPPSFASLPFGLLRIDYVFGSSQMEFESTHVDCVVGSDHCAVLTTIDIGAFP